MKKTLIILTIFFALWFNSSVFSQDKVMPFNIGLYGGVGINSQNPSFYDITSITLDTFLINNGNTSVGGVIGLIANFPINNTFTISGRLGYHNVSGQASTTMNTGESHTYKTNLSYFEISPILQIHNLFPVKPLYLLAGLEFGIPLSPTYDYTYYEPITPSQTTTLGIPFQNKTNRIALAIGAGYIFDLAKNIYLTPEISYRLPFNNIDQGGFLDSWKVSQLRLGVNLTFGISSEEVPQEQVKENKYLELGEPKVTYNDDQMTAQPVDKIKVEEVQYNELYPLLPYVFYPQNKSVPEPTTATLSAQNEAGEFKIDKLQQDAVKINTYTLDIVGTRLKDSKSKDLTITGTVDSKEGKTNKTLSKERADFCKNYLVANYGVDPSRINVIAGGFPAKPSSKIDPEGEAENRRAEISGNPDLLKPIVISGEKDRVTTPQIIDFSVDYKTNDSVSSYTLKYYQAGTLIHQIDGNGMPHNISWQIAPNQLLESQTPVDWEFTTTTTSGLTKTLNGSIPVDYFSFSRKKSENLPDKVVSKFSLVLFDFDSPVVSDQDKDILDKNVIPAISAKSTVQIYGYTDRIGDADYNKKLAAQRAENVKAYLQSKVQNVKFETYGIGESVQLYNNNLTSGRQLSRTVQIYIVTPKN